MWGLPTSHCLIPRAGLARAASQLTESQRKEGIYLDGMLKCLQHSNARGLSHQGGLAQTSFYVSPSNSSSILGSVNPHCQQGQTCNLEKTKDSDQLPLQDKARRMTCWSLKHSLIGRSHSRHKRFRLYGWLIHLLPGGKVIKHRSLSSHSVITEEDTN